MGVTSLHSIVTASEPHTANRATVDCLSEAAACFDGCAYGLKYDGEAVLKKWLVATSSRDLWLHLSRRCSGGHEHRECRGPVVQASTYYPKAMVQCVVKAFKEQWSRPRGSESHVQNNIFKREDLGPGFIDYTPQILALRRQRFPSELITGKKLESNKQQMLRVH